MLALAARRSPRAPRKRTRERRSTTEAGAWCGAVGVGRMRGMDQASTFAVWHEACLKTLARRLLAASQPPPAYGPDLQGSLKRRSLERAASSACSKEHVSAAPTTPASTTPASTNPASANPASATGRQQAAVHVPWHKFEVGDARREAASPLKVSVWVGGGGAVTAGCWSLKVYPWRRVRREPLSQLLALGSSASLHCVERQGHRRLSHGRPYCGCAV